MSIDWLSDKKYLSNDRDKDDKESIILYFWLL